MTDGLKVQAMTDELSKITDDVHLYNAIFNLLSHAIDTVREAVDAVAHPRIAQRMTNNQQESLCGLMYTVHDLPIPLVAFCPLEEGCIDFPDDGMPVYAEACQSESEIDVYDPVLGAMEPVDWLQHISDQMSDGDSDPDDVVVGVMKRMRQLIEEQADRGDKGYENDVSLLQDAPTLVDKCPE